jgi:hypothetical protein
LSRTFYILLDIRYPVNIKINKIKKIEAAVGFVASNHFNGLTNLKLAKLVGRWIAALPSKPVHNTVHVSSLPKL